MRPVVRIVEEMSSLLGCRKNQHCRRSSGAEPKSKKSVMARSYCAPFSVHDVDQVAVTPLTSRFQRGALAHRRSSQALYFVSSLPRTASNKVRCARLFAQQSPCPYWSAVEPSNSYSALNSESQRTSEALPSMALPPQFQGVRTHFAGR
jgi:hypothetical protein